MTKNSQERNPVGAVMVVGGGIAGVQAALDLADSGFYVYLVERMPGIGGVMVLVCGTCLQHFQVLEQKQVGETTNMLDIVTHMQLAGKVIPLT